MAKLAFLGMDFTCLLDALRQARVPSTDCVLPLMSKVLGYAIVAGSPMVKLPQIIIILRNKSIKGLSIASFELEVVGFTIALAYCLFRELPFSAYGELVFLLLQALILVALIYYYSPQRAPSVWMKTALYVAIAPTLMAGNIGDVLFETLYASQHAIFFVSRLPQIYENYSTKGTGQLSLLTNVMTFGGCVVRLFTSLQEKAPSSMVLGSVLGFITNGIVLGQIVLYGSGSAPVSREKKAA